jgi:ubiquinol-cytochrome c reductase iron-sulfur subunit
MNALRVLLAAILLWLRRGRPDPPLPPPEPDPARRELPRDGRAELLVALLLLAAGLLGGGLFVVYLLDPDTQLLGLALGLALAALAGAAILAGKRVVAQETAVEERPPLADPDAQRETAALAAGAGDGVSRRGLIAGAAGIAGGGLALGLAAPLASLGPNVDGRIDRSPWARGRAVVDEQGRPILADDVVEGTFLTGFPDGAHRRDLAAPIVIVRIGLAALQLPTGRDPATWAPEGILAYSKICTHAGCAIALYRKPTFTPTQPRPALVCPCHYSTFDPARGADVIFGPAGRPLPQLPLAIDPATRALVANGDFSGSVGPAWWSVKRGNA